MGTLLWDKGLESSFPCQGSFPSPQALLPELILEAKKESRSCPDPVRSVQATLPEVQKLLCLGAMRALLGDINV